MEEHILYNGNKISPMIKYNSPGKVFIEGRSYAENTDQYFELLYNWVQTYNHEQIEINMMMDYFNSSSSKWLFNIIKFLEDNSKIKQLAVNWFYDDEDEEMIEAGEVFESEFEKAKFSYHLLS